MLELSHRSSLRAFRLEASYTAARLNASEDTRPHAAEFEEAAERFRLLDEEESRLALRKVDTQASIEAADDAWDDTVHGFRRRLLELSNNSVDAPLYRTYFADIPSHVTSLSHAAEIMISKDLERALRDEPNESLRLFSEQLETQRLALEAILHERTRVEVDEARFANRVSLAKSILNKLRRVLWAELEELALHRGVGREWCARFFLGHQDAVSPAEAEAVEDVPSFQDGAGTHLRLPEPGG